MKAKRLLSAFVTVAMMVTMLVSFSAVTYAEDKASMNISFVELTEDEIAELEATFEEPVVTVPEGTTPYWLMVTINDYGTISSKSTGAGTKFGSFQAKLKFDGQVTDYIERETTGEYWWALDMGEIGMASMGISDLATDGVPGTTMSVSWAGGVTGKTCWPTGAVSGRTDEVLLCQIPVAVKKGFTATVTEGLYEIKTYTSNTAFTSESFYGSKAEVILQQSVTVEGSAPATTYNVKFMNGDTEVSSATLEEGAAITAPAAPTKAADAQYTYTFAGWSTDGTNVVDVAETATADVTYYAVYTKTVNKYDIKFIANDKETVVSTEYGAMPVAPTVESYTDAKGGLLYTFKNWTPDIVAVTGEATYTAVYEESMVDLEANYVNIVFNVCGKTTVVRVEKGQPIPFPTEVTFPEDDCNYEFVGWTNDETSAGTPVDGEVIATVNDTYYAMFKSDLKAPVINSFVFENANGVANLTETKIYDNAIKAYANITPTNATKVTFLFIPAKVAGDADDWTLAAKAVADSNVIGDGKVDYTAAIVNIPRKYENKPITFLSKVIVEYGKGLTVVSDAKSAILTFGNTGE